MKLETIKEQAMKLPPDEKAELVHSLLVSMDEDKWLLEALKRANQIDEGKAELLPYKEVKDKARSLLK